MQTRKAPDFWGLHKNKNCAFPLKITSFIKLTFSFNFTLNTKFQQHLNKKHLFYHACAYKITESNSFSLIVWLPT